MSEVPGKGVTANAPALANATATASAPGPVATTAPGPVATTAPVSAAANNNQGNGSLSTTRTLSQRARQMFGLNQYGNPSPAPAPAAATGSSSGQIVNLIFQWFMFLTLSVAVPILVGKFLPGYANTALTSCLWTIGIFGGIFLVIAGISIMMNVYRTDGLSITIMSGILGAYLSPIIVICYWVYHFIGYFFKWERHPYFGLFPLGIYSSNRWLDMGIEIFHDSRYYYDASDNLMQNFHLKNTPDKLANVGYDMPLSFEGYEGGYPDLLKKANGILYGMVARPAGVMAPTTNPVVAGVMAPTTNPVAAGAAAANAAGISTAAAANAATRTEISKTATPPGNKTQPNLNAGDPN